MERSSSEQIERAPHPAITRSKTGASKRVPRHHERWLVEARIAVRRADGRLRPTARGHEVGAALFGYTG
jgi:hypothetical protein